MSTAAADYRKLAKRYRTLPEKMVRAGAAELRKTTLSTLKGDVGSDRMMSGMTRRKGLVRHQPMNVSVKVETVGREMAIATFTPVKRQTGMWSIIEGGTVTGSPAKFTFTRGVAAGLNAAEDAMADTWEKTV